MIMKNRLRRSAIALLAFALLFGPLLMSLSNVLAQISCVKVDLFTQKQPYSGIGPNMPSDAFGPEEAVILSALVTCNDFPFENILVSFDVKSPNGTHFSLSARTNSSGIATVSFGIKTPPINISETEVFGIWIALANVQVEDEIFQDTLTFRVDWVVKLLSVRTIDQDRQDETYFGRDGDVGLEITLRSIAMTLRNATIGILIQDELAIPVNYTEITDIAIQPNEKLVILYTKSTFIKTAYVGMASVIISALTAPVNKNGVPYCPPISAEFVIKGEDPLKIDYHDAAVVAVLPSARTIEIGQGLNLTTLVRNEGTVAESFSVSTYFDNVNLGTRQVTSLPPYSAMTFNFTVDPSLLTLGQHAINASIPPVPNEADLTDNYFTDTVEVKLKPPPIIHDIAITNIELSNSSVFIGENVKINVTVFNKGTEVETFDLGVYYNSSLINIHEVTSLAPASQMTYTFVWHTTFLKEGIYRISAFAPLPEDVNFTDNTLVDGTVEVKAKPPPVPVHDVAITAVHASSYLVYIGDVVEIMVVAENVGGFNESFAVTASANSTVIGTMSIENLVAGAERVLPFYWDTLNAAEGNYTVSAYAAAVSDEVNLENNLYVNGVVQVKTGVPPTEIHNVAILNVVPSTQLAYVGSVLNISVSVKNKGLETESFNITIYANQIAIGEVHIERLSSSAEMLVIFEWNTSNVPLGYYLISAVADRVEGETELQDNVFSDGTVTVMPFPSPYPSEFSLLGLGALALIIVIALIAGLCLLLLIYCLKRPRRRKKTARRPYKIIAHLHI